MINRGLNYLIAIMMAVSICTIPVLVWASGDIAVTREFVAFSMEQELYVVRVVDVNRGSYFSVRKLEDSSVVKEVPYQLDNEDTVLKTLKKKYKITDEGVVGQQSPKGEYTIMGAAKGEKFEVMATAANHLGTVHEVELRKEDTTNKPAVAMLKQVVWSPDGKWLVLVINQKVGGAFPSDQDDVIVMPFRGYKIQWR